MKSKQNLTQHNFARWPSGMQRILSATALTAALFSAAPGVAQARDLRYAFGLPETFATYKPMVNYANVLTKEAGVPMKVFAMSLLNLAETPTGLRDGLADNGWLTTPYMPVEYSEINLVANLSMLAVAGMESKVPEAAMAGAAMEYTLLNCPDCVNQMKSMNQVYVGGASSPPYVLMCNKPITTVAALKGKRLRSGAGNYTRWAEYFGAAGVSLPGNEIYDALGQGVVDCTMNAMADLTGNRYIDVTKNITVGVPGAVFSGLVSSAFNKKAWMELSETQRAAVIKATPRMVAEIAVVYHDFDVAAYDAARKKGIPIAQAPADMKAKTNEFVEQDMKVIEQQFTEKFGVKNVKEKIALARRLVDKWKGLTNSTGYNLNAIADLYWKEIFSKVDAKTYGMN